MVRSFRGGDMSKLLEFCESNHKQSTAAKKAMPEYAAWASKWLAGFQQNEHAHHWPEFAEKLLIACEEGKMDLVKKCWWASMINSDLDATGLPAIVIWGMKRAASIDHLQDMYEYLNVNLQVSDIRGESFYGGFPNPTMTDKKLGAFLNKMDIY